MVREKTRLMGVVGLNGGELFEMASPRTREQRVAARRGSRSSCTVECDERARSGKREREGANLARLTRASRPFARRSPETPLFRNSRHKVHGQHRTTRPNSVWHALTPFVGSALCPCATSSSPLQRARRQGFCSQLQRKAHGVAASAPGAFT